MFLHFFWVIIFIFQLNSVTIFSCQNLGKISDTLLWGCNIRIQPPFLRQSCILSSQNVSRSRLVRVAVLRITSVTWDFPLFILSSILQPSRIPSEMIKSRFNRNIFISHSRLQVYPYSHVATRIPHPSSRQASEGPPIPLTFYWSPLQHASKVDTPRRTCQMPTMRG